MSALRAFLLIFVLWALLYLPGLGSMEIKGEEGRRILPAVEMLETANWLVPHIAGEPYLRKPPLINWAIAGSFEVFGVRNEWAARIPSVFCMLLLGFGLLAAVGSALSWERGLLAALFVLTNISSLEKGRLAEIEAMYVAWTGLAFAAWLWGVWAQKQAWLGWILAGIFLGLGMLTKGPAHLLFFYGVVMAVFAFSKRLKDLLHPAHWVCVVLCIGMYAAWAIPHLQAAKGLGAAGVWANQFTGRMSGEGFEFGQWLINFPRGILNFLPWVVFLPLLFKAKKPKGREMGLVFGLCWGILLSFLVVMLMPGSIPRYTLPLLAPAALLAAIAVTPLGEPVAGVWAACVKWFIAAAGTAALAGTVLKIPMASRLGLVALALVALLWWLSGMRANKTIPGLVASSGLVMILITGIYAAAALPLMRSHEDVRPLAAPINRIERKGQSLVVLNPGFQPFLFYIRQPVRYAATLADVPEDTRFLLLPRKEVTKMKRKRAWQNAELRAETEDKKKERLLLFERKLPARQP